MWGIARCCLPRSPGQPQHLKYQNRIWWWWWYGTIKTRHRGTRKTAKPSKIKARYSRPTCKNCSSFVLHYNSTQYCNTETFFSIFPFLQTNITSQMWPSHCKTFKLNNLYVQYRKHTCKTLSICNEDIINNKHLAACDIPLWSEELQKIRISVEM